MASSTVVKDSAGKNDGGPRRGRSASVGRFVGRSILLLLIVCIVIGLGTMVVGGPSEPEPPSATEVARMEAERSALVLAQDAAALGAAAADAPARGALLESAELLQRQAAALSLDGTGLDGTGPDGSGPAPTTAPIPAPTASGTASASPGTDAPPSFPGLVDALAESSRTNLVRAAEVEPGMARLLASVGTGQWLQAVRLAEATGLPAPGPVPAPETADPGAVALGTAPAASASPGAAASPTPSVSPTSCPTGPAAADQSADQSAEPAVGADSDGLAAALEAERRTVYAYEVAAARLPAPVAGAAAALLDAHRTAAGEAAQLAEDSCRTVPEPEPGYRLPADFMAAPAAGLALVEDELAGLYADLVGLSDDAVQMWAIGQLLETSAQRLAWTDDPEPLPGMDLPETEAAETELPGTGPAPQTPAADTGA
jgi:Domain of unknown function (DUF4439)